MPTIGPLAVPGTRFRVTGPRVINGMKTWVVNEVLFGGRIGRQIGPQCLSREEARALIDDLIKGKRTIWFGHNRFEPRKL